MNFKLAFADRVPSPSALLRKLTEMQTFPEATAVFFINFRFLC